MPDWPPGAVCAGASVASAAGVDGPDAGADCPDEPAAAAGDADWPESGAGASDCPASVAGCRGESESGAVCRAGSAAGAGAPDWPESGAVSGGASTAGAGALDWPESGAASCGRRCAGLVGVGRRGAQRALRRDWPESGAGSPGARRQRALRRAPDWPESGAGSGGASAAGAEAPDWPESGGLGARRQRAPRRRIGRSRAPALGRLGSGRRGAGLAGVGRRLCGRLGSGRRLDCQRRGRGWRQLQRDAAPQRCGRADRGPGAVGGEPPARVDGAGVQLPAVAGGCIANLYGRHRRHRIAQQTGARPALFAEAVGHVEHAAVEARQHHHGARRRRIVAQPGYLLVVQVALGQEADGGGEMVPVGAAVGGLVDAVEGGAEQHAGGVVGRQRHAGKVGMRVYLFGGHRLPRHAAVAAHEHGRRSGGGQPPGIGRIDGQ